MKKVTFIIAVLFSLMAISQVTNEGKPVSWDLDLERKIDYIHLPIIDLDKIVEEDELSKDLQGVPYRIGVPIAAKYSTDNSGLWTDLNNGDRIWQLAIHSEGAIQMSFNFESFKLPVGAKLYFYNDSKSDLLGAYTHTQNQESGILGTWFVQGDKIWIEYYEPSEVAGEGELSLENVVHCYRSAGKHQSAAAQQKLNESGDCNHDVDCPIGADWEDFKELNKKAAAFLNMNNGYICSGTMINNTAFDYTPYFLTADHCYDGSNPASWAMRFRWISTSPSCGTTTGSTNGPTYRTISGATLRAVNSATDFCLVEINSTPPAAWDLTYAGWDKSDAYPTMGVGIHHPGGDIMKVCRDNDQWIKTTIGGKSVWRNNQAQGSWDIGVTEQGSSGSALYDQNGRIVGQLWAGSSECVGTDDNDLYDIYGRVGVSWTGSSAATRLSDWLDPLGTDPDFIDGYSASAEVDEFLNNLIDIYPNPTTGVVNVQIKNSTSDFTYSVFNAIGQEVTKGNISTSNAVIDMQDLNDGLYFIKLAENNSQKHMIKKVVVRK